MTSIERFVLSLSVNEREAFWKSLDNAISWKGWDREGVGILGTGKPCMCHACHFIRDVDELAKRHGKEFEEYT